MDHDLLKTVAGRVADVFAHRFVVETATGRILADLGPRGARELALRVGDEVELTGEAKPSEVKVRRIVVGGRTVDIERGKKHDGDPQAARQAVEARGLRVVGAPRLKPKHAEVLGRDPSGRLFEMHVEHDGTLRKSKPIGNDDSRWAAEIAAAS